MNEWFRRFAARVAHAMGSHWAFLGALLTVLIWSATGPMYHFSDTWQIVINTGTTIITFLMVFVVQATQNRDAEAIHLKLDELILALKEARDDFARIEKAPDSRIRTLQEDVATRVNSYEQSVNSVAAQSPERGADDGDKR